VETLIVLSREDPVARGVGPLLGQGEAEAWHIDGAPVRRLSPKTLALWREPLHINDEGLNAALPDDLKARISGIVFPSMHKSESGNVSLTVHPVGNLTPEAVAGGRPLTVNPVPAHLMTEAYLRLREEGLKIGIETSFESTHHGPYLEFPCFFVEIGSTATEWGRPDVHHAIARTIMDLDVDRVANDRIAIGIGGGHYVPRFKDLVRKRAVSMAHMVPSHKLGYLDEALAKELVRASPGVEGCFFAKAGERETTPMAQLLPELHEKALGPRAP
jgi:D-aminoacyl-tRNA deacylase